MSVEADWGKSDLEVHLRFMGDWGITNLFSACGWIATGLRWRTAKTSTFIVHTGRGYKDNVDAVLDGTVDVAITTPIVTAAMALEGRGLYDAPHPGLRALAVLPHRDRLVLAIAADVAERYGIASYEDLAAKRPPLRIVTGLNDGVNHVGFAVERVLNAYGIAWDDIERWGGRWFQFERPPKAPAMVVSGEADAIFYEAIMTWHGFTERRLMRFLPIDPPVLEELYKRYGYLQASIEPGEFRGVNKVIPTLEWSGWLIVVREDMPEEIAHLITRVIVEDRADFEGKYKHLPVTQSPLHYPIRPEELWKTAPVPLHPGAERYYREQGLIH
ncbi:MAG TPA: TAXI family TRAP transporter solute-binding subunit [Chloroflexota bacterium]|jgi:TRAP transporter TAXI family solute receptor|nr:TAXI family TRAP transporter solute-binding subunit [Chloroflexota bacterium]